MLKLSMSLTGIIFATILASSSPSIAQTQEEIIVTSRYGKVPDNVQTVSQNVSYADLDLSTKAGKEELRRRVSLTARFLCDKLGESATSSPQGPSCRDAATKDAIERVGTVEASFAPRGTGWVTGSRWEAPYPPDWAQRYP